MPLASVVITPHFFFLSMSPVDDESFGVIPLKREEEEWKVFLILHRKGNHWGFPKGHRQGDETPLESAQRELKEETGFEVERFLQENPLVDRYQFRRQGNLIVKRVFYYPALVTGVFKMQVEEIREGAWMSFEQALTQLTFKEGRAICKQIMESLK